MNAHRNKSRRFVFQVAVLGLTLCAGALIAAPLYADPANLPVYQKDPVVAVVEGESITLDDLKTAQSHEAMVQLHKLLMRDLKEKILEKLSRKHPEIKLDQVPKVTQADIVEFYEKTPGVKELGTLEQMQTEVRDYLENAFKASYIDQQYHTAVDKGWATVYLTPPNDFHLVASPNTAILWFNDDKNHNRRVFVLEFSDFQCPFCKRVQSTLSLLRRRYPEEVQFGYRHFPLPFHKEAKAMAEAAECARDQGRFWEIQSLFYRDPAASDLGRIMELAKQAGIKDLKQFQRCWENGKYQDRVANDIREGVQVGITGTPTFILGLLDPEKNTITGEMFSGAVSEDRFVRTIEKYLAIVRTEAKLNR